MKGPIDERSPPALELPGYEMGATIRRGPGGWWMRARQVRIDRDVLVKVAPPGNVLAAGALEREVDVLGRARHPGLLAVIDYDGDAWAPWAVLEFPEGEDLEATVRALGGRVPPRRAADLCAEAGGILGALRAAGGAARRLSPNDLHVGAGDRVRLAGLEGTRPGGLAGEALGAGGGDDDFSAAALWSAPRELGERGDLFLLGLLFFYLLTGKAPVPVSIRGAPSRWLDMAARALAGEGAPGGADAAPSDGATVERDRTASLALLRRLLAPAGERLDLDGAVRELEAIRDGEGGRRRRPRLPRPLTEIALVAAALVAGGVIGIRGWIALESAGTAGPDAPIPAADTGADALADAAAGAAADTDGAAVAVADADTPAPAAAGADPDAAADEDAMAATAADTATVADPAPPPPPAVASAAITDTTAPPADPSPQPRRTPPPPLDAVVDSPGDAAAPPRAPSALERFLSRVVAAGRADAGEARWDELWSEGVAVAGEIAAGGGAEAAVDRPESSRAEFTRALVRVRAAVEERAIRASIFAAAPETANDGLDDDGLFVKGDVRDSVNVRYPFDSHDELADWHAAGEGSRVLISGGRLVVLGEARLAHGRFLREPISLSLRLPAGKGTERPNVNVAFWVGEAAVPPVFFGLGSDLASGSFRAAGGRRVMLPASLVLAPAAGATADPRTWRVLWSAPRHGGADGAVTVQWTADGVRWTENGRDVVPPPEMADVLGRLGPLAGRRGEVAIHALDETLEIDAVRLEAALDVEKIAAEARRAAEAKVAEILAFGPGERLR